MRPEPLFVLPIGTQVVTRVAVHTARQEVRLPAGAVGVIARVPTDPEHAYRVRFPDGAEHAFLRRELTVRKQHVEIGKAAHDDADYTPYVHLRVVVGSRAFGLAGEGSDVDRRGFYLPPAEAHWGLWGVPEQLENDATQETYWELRKFLLLALKANPNVLEVLHSPLVEFASPLATDLLGMRRVFLSTLVYQTYNGYVLSQFKRMEADRRQHGEARPKHVMHLLRLLISGVQVLRTGEMVLDVGEHRERLLAVKRGETPWDEVNAWRLDLHRDFDAALAGSPLPERPDHAAANAFLLRARREAAGPSGGRP